MTEVSGLSDPDEFGPRGRADLSPGPQHWGAQAGLHPEPQQICHPLREVRPMGFTQLCSRAFMCAKSQPQHGTDVFFFLI